MKAVTYTPAGRLVLPLPPLAILCIVIGLALLVVGILASMKVRRHMNEDAGWGERLFILPNMSTLGYLLHDYDATDKPIVMLLFVARIPGILLLFWGVFGLLFAP